MQILWVVLIVLAALGIFRGVLAVRNGGTTGIWGRINRPTIMVAAIIIAIAWGLFAATQLGFIPDHAP